MNWEVFFIAYFAGAISASLMWFAHWLWKNDPYDGGS